MRFLDIFSAQHDPLVISFMMSTEIFEFCPYLCPWQLFKEGTCKQISQILSMHFQMTISQAWNGLFQKFQSLELIVLSALALKKDPGQ